MTSRRRSYTAEFKESAVRLVTEQGYPCFFSIFSICPWSDKVHYMTVPYYLEQYRKREIIEGIPIVKRKKSLLVA